MVSLRSFNYKDIKVLHEHGYADLSDDDLHILIDKWNKNIYNNLYFEMFAIENDNEIVGYASLYQRSKNIISCGLEIYPNHQRKGFASNAYYKLLIIARDKGYKIAVAQVLEDNKASIALHRKLGFEAEEYVYINKKGNKIFYFIKTI